MIEVVKQSQLVNLFGGEFEFINDGYNTGSFNMDFDYERTKAVACGEALPMFRLYGWKPWSVSLGANQKESDIDTAECGKRGFTIVRRPTGGRAVLHANELTYSVVLKMPKGFTVHDVYRDIHVVLLEGLKKLGCDELDFEKAQPDFRNFYKESGMSVSCFASSARYEISARGKKVIGSAQRLFGDTLLQHGSILLGSGHEQLAEVTNTPSAEHKKILLKYILNHSITLSEVCGRDINYDESALVITEAVRES